MATCSMCKKHGLFLKVDIDGFCPACRIKYDAARAAAIQKKEQERVAFAAQVEALPHFAVRRDGQKMRMQATSFLQDLTFTKPTKSSDPMKFCNFVSLDIETTGLSAVQNDVLEIAAVRVEGFTILEVFHTLVKPPRGIVSDAAAINGITAEMVANAPEIHEVIPSLQEFIAGQNLLGHGLSFDLKFLCRHGLDVTSEKRKFFDSKLISQAFYKNTTSYGTPSDHSLESMCRYYRIERFDGHRALGDCIDTTYLFRNLCEERIDTSAATL